MNSSPITSITNRPTENPAIDRALNMLTEAGIDFEVVDRCPATCMFCDEAISSAA